MADSAGARAALDRIVEAVARHPAMAAKRDIGLVSEVLGGADWLAGPGDDGAAVAVGSETVIACGEAIFPPFVASDPRGAGIAAVVANVNDVAAMGAEPLALVDTIVADRETARRVLEGMRWAADRYRVPIVGGHLTISDGPPSLSAFAVGRTATPLSITRAAPGHDLVVAACLDGRMRDDFPFFTSLEARTDRLGDDVRVLHRIAAQGLAESARDISMAGLVGSLAMLLEHGGLGAHVDVASVPAPAATPAETWLTCFPTYGFLLTCDPVTTAECVAAFTDAGLSAARVGSVTGTGRITLGMGAEVADCVDVVGSPATGIARPAP